MVPASLLFSGVFVYARHVPGGLASAGRGLLIGTSLGAVFGAFHNTVKGAEAERKKKIVEQKVEEVSGDQSVLTSTNRGLGYKSQAIFQWSVTCSLSE